MVPLFLQELAKVGEEDTRQSPIRLASWQERTEPGTKLGLGSSTRVLVDTHGGRALIAHELTVCSLGWGPTSAHSGSSDSSRLSRASIRPWG